MIGLYRKAKHLSKRCPMKPVANSKKTLDVSYDLCPECKLSAHHIDSALIEKRLLVNTFMCPNGHQFSKKVNLKYAENLVS